jgi:hypothetical protein
VLPPYRPRAIPDEQAKALANRIGSYRVRRGYLRSFDDSVAHLDRRASANQFEKALADLAEFIGLSSERHDVNGEGPDVLWLLPDKTGWVIEAKSRKNEKKALTKEEHGQLLVAAEWFSCHYSDFECVRVSVHPAKLATTAAVAGASHALTYARLNALVTDARALLTSLCGSQLSGLELEAECAAVLRDSPVRHDGLVDAYLQVFEVAG